MQKPFFKVTWEDDDVWLSDVRGVGGPDIHLTRKQAGQIAVALCPAAKGDQTKGSRTIMGPAK